MKGMQKIKRGKCFSGIIHYALKSVSHHKTVPRVIGGNMLGSSTTELIDEFNTAKKLREDVVKPVWHNSLRLPKGDTLTDYQWSNIADDYMARMGFSGTHLKCYVLHDDINGQHIHIIACRIDLNDSRLYLGKNENLISTRIIQELEEDYKLTRTKGPSATGAPSSKSKNKKSRGEDMLEKRTGKSCSKVIIQEAIQTLLVKSLSTIEFVHQLKERNIVAIPNISSTGRMNGFSFKYGNMAFKASQLGKIYSWSALQNRINYIPDRDNAFLFNLKVSYSETPDMIIPSGITIEEVNPRIEVPALCKTSDNDYTKKCISTILSNSEGVLTNAPKLSFEIPKFRWLETIPYIDAVISLLKNIKILTLKRPKNHSTISNIRVAKIAPLYLATTAEPVSVHRKRSPSL
ncbi:MULTISPECIES: relaxase/mobilization nuclease domain-containing protein [Klebsiella]|uniref:relaxase/mobilization nuclease domain-containing protein n=1 Tax=Klebsiella TaxID=570 RepID=UPI0013FD14DD|nr:MULTISPECIES: relaxase/mobilization nuclease domain-containing protein [Klebsiella]MCT1424016.1 relaxase/mobilization nuclease domain-containing protein [Klebsiella aerogenes]MCT1501900.1 relaxase/mobilization nuclease domain-containing protein [Klebsiella aerogenes]MCT1794509.1 relaxase/mobilization nuclease domain-containing protein [Klebsiella aerogenes]MCT2311669.1 relaxase/mobilization nuclease domain-containing protein [Klebsiella aerogenes]MCT2319543.1 relaxase/mobilization nuclease 